MDSEWWIWKGQIDREKKSLWLQTVNNSMVHNESINEMYQNITSMYVKHSNKKDVEIDTELYHGSWILDNSSFA